MPVCLPETDRSRSWITEAFDGVVNRNTDASVLIGYEHGIESEASAAMAPLGTILSKMTHPSRARK